MTTVTRLYQLASQLRCIADWIKHSAVSSFDLVAIITIIFYFWVSIKTY